MEAVLARKYPIIHNRHYSFVEDEEAQHDEFLVHYARVEAMLETKAPLLPQGKTYLNSRLHDSWVLRFTRTKDDFAILLNDFQSHCFCAALSFLRGDLISHRLAVLPLCLLFVQVRKITVSHVNRHGKLLAVKAERLFTGKCEFLCDEVGEIEDGHTSIGILFWKDKMIKGDKRLLLEVEAKKLSIQEQQRQDFVDLFGEELVSWFDLHMDARKKNAWYFDYSSSLDFLREHHFPG